MAEYNILIVEDESFSALSLKLNLQKRNYNVCDVVSSGEKAIASAKEHDPDVILMDIRIGGDLDGIETASAIREFCDCEIIFLSGYQEGTFRQRAEALEPLAYLIKPVSIKSVIDAIKEI